MHWTYLDVKLADSLSAKIQPQVIHLLGVFSFSGSIFGPPSAHSCPATSAIDGKATGRPARRRPCWDNVGSRLGGRLQGRSRRSITKIDAVPP